MNSDSTGGRRPAGLLSAFSVLLFIATLKQRCWEAPLRTDHTACKTEGCTGSLPGKPTCHRSAARCPASNPAPAQLRLLPGLLLAGQHPLTVCVRGVESDLLWPGLRAAAGAPALHRLNELSGSCAVAGLRTAVLVYTDRCAPCAPPPPPPYMEWGCDTRDQLAIRY